MPHSSEKLSEHDAFVTNFIKREENLFFLFRLAFEDHNGANLCSCYAQLPSSLIHMHLVSMETFQYVAALLKGPSDSIKVAISLNERALTRLFEALVQFADARTSKYKRHHKPKLSFSLASSENDDKVASHREEAQHSRGEERINVHLLKASRGSRSKSRSKSPRRTHQHAAIHLAPKEVHDDSAAVSATEDPERTRAKFHGSHKEGMLKFAHHKKSDASKDASKEDSRDKLSREDSSSSSDSVVNVKRVHHRDKERKHGHRTAKDKDKDKDNESLSKHRKKNDRRKSDEFSHKSPSLAKKTPTSPDTGSTPSAASAQSKSAAKVADLPKISNSVENATEVTASRPEKPSSEGSRTHREPLLLNAGRRRPESVPSNSNHDHHAALAIKTLDLTPSKDLAMSATPRYTLTPQDSSIQEISRRSSGPSPQPGLVARSGTPSDASETSEDDVAEPASPEVYPEQERLLSQMVNDLFDVQPYPLIAFLHDCPQFGHALFRNFDADLVKFFLALFRCEQQLFIISGTSDRRSLFEKFHFGKSLIVALSERPRPVRPLTPLVVEMILFSPWAPPGLRGFAPVLRRSR